MSNLRDKKLLVLGGNPETGILVRTANALGVTTIVVDPNPTAPAKQFAARSYHIDGFNVAAIAAVARQEQVDGVLVGVADILVSSYERVCAELGLPCYATPLSAAAFTSKDGLRDTLLRHGIECTPTFKLDASLRDEDVANLEYPLVLKPVDSGAGVGMVVCGNASELDGAAQKALRYSMRGEFIAERYMQCDDTFVYYTFKDGEIFLSAMADRITTRAQEGTSLVCLAALYPSRHMRAYVEREHPRVSNMIRALGVRDGVLCVQYWVEGEHFYAYDPGFRLQGEAPHVYIQHFNGFDHREMLVEFALTGSMGTADISAKNDPDFGGRHACTLWFILKSGTVGEIQGLDAVSEDPSVIFTMQRFQEGDEVTAAMVGTERQVLARVYLVADTYADLVAAIHRVNDKVQVIDSRGRDMIVDRFMPSSA